ncbi:MAG: DegT/DnrJ/EryC1/StrS family aminotransferase [Thaumarchaeota archaeon]|nr:DegT/DnrJ/EryC1/StrS family aminotransferase [Nitrososphaerota archaeon]
MIPQMVPYWDNKEKEAMQDVLNGDFINEHKRVREFEKLFAKYVCSKYCVLVTSGSVALYMALLVHKIESIDKMKIPSYQGIFVAHALKQVNKIPVIIDTDENGLLPYAEPDSIQVFSNGRLGSSGIIEDTSQATFYHTKDRISCYSFAPTKHLTMGQGGAICCDDYSIFEELTRIKDHGRTDRLHLKTPKDEFDSWGTNFKVTEFQASFGLEQLKKLPKRYERLHEIYKIYQDELNSKVKFLEQEPKWFIDIYVENPQELIDHLKKHDIIAKRVHKPIHLQPEFSEQQSLPNSEYIYNHGVFLPSTTNLTDNQVVDICRAILNTYLD